ncbi:glycosyltransferase [Micromonospora chersina]|uniref:glycosyltransferase n=1 Tax=Micromonospora chersina TaxID=47854 RepID=UPI00371CEA7B
MASEREPRSNPATLPWIVLCAVNLWTGTARTDRHMATQLSRYARVLWVEPPVSVVTPAASRYGAARGFRPRLIPEGPRITRLVTVAQPFYTRRLIRLATPALVRAQIRWALRRLRVTPAAVITFSATDLLGRWGDEVVDVLYATDDFLAGADLLGISAADIAKEEKAALSRADRIVAVSPVLADKWRARGADPVLVPGGVLAEAYAEVDAAPLPADVRLPAPVAGVVGHLSNRIDIGLLEAVVEGGTSLLLVGSRDERWEPERFAKLTAHPRVSYVGHRPFAALPSYLKMIDVGLTPYVDNAFNRASFPLKTLEYLAAGRPAVSTDLPAIRWLDTDLIEVASGPEQFSAAVRTAALRARQPDLVARRRLFAARHSWPRRARTVAEAIGLIPTGEVAQAEAPSAAG